MGDRAGYDFMYVRLWVYETGVGEEGGMNLWAYETGDNW